MKLLSSHGIPYRRINTSGILSNGTWRPSQSVGFPDIVACVPGGRMLLIEVKSEKGKLSPEQKKTLDEFENSGAIAIVARHPVDVFNVLVQNGVLRSRSLQELAQDYLNQSPQRL